MKGYPLSLIALLFFSPLPAEKVEKVKIDIVFCSPKVLGFQFSVPLPGREWYKGAKVAIPSPLVKELLTAQGVEGVIKTRHFLLIWTETGEVRQKEEMIEKVVRKHLQRLRWEIKIGHNECELPLAP